MYNVLQINSGGLSIYNYWLWDEPHWFPLGSSNNISKLQGEVLTQVKKSSQFDSIFLLEPKLESIWLDFDSKCVEFTSSFWLKLNSSWTSFDLSKKISTRVSKNSTRLDSTRGRLDSTLIYIYILAGIPGVAQEDKTAS